VLAASLQGSAGLRRMQATVVAGRVQPLNDGSDADDASERSRTSARLRATASMPNLPGLVRQGDGDSLQRSRRLRAERSFSKRSALFAPSNRTPGANSSVLSATVFRPAGAALVQTASAQRIPIYRPTRTRASDLIEEARAAAYETQTQPTPIARLRTLAPTAVLPQAHMRDNVQDRDAFARKSSLPPGAWEHGIAMHSDPTVARMVRTAQLDLSMGGRASAIAASRACLSRSQAGHAASERVRQSYDVEKQLEHARGEARVASIAAQQLRYALASDPAIRFQ
jgi:hypothetical protein